MSLWGNIAPVYCGISVEIMTEIKFVMITWKTQIFFDYEMCALQAFEKQVRLEVRFKHYHDRKQGVLPLRKVEMVLTNRVVVV